MLYASAFPSIATALAIFEKNTIPATLGLIKLDPRLEQSALEFFASSKTRESNASLRPIHRILINNFGFYGCYSCFVLERSTAQL